MATKTGFSVYTAEQMYEQDGILQRDVRVIAQHLELRSPFSEAARSSIKDFVKQAKVDGKTIAQSLQMQARQPNPVPQFSDEDSSDRVGIAADEFAQQAQQRQVQLMQSRIAAAIQDLALDRTAKNLALAQLAASNWDLSAFPALQAMVQQSEQMLSLVEAETPALLPFGCMVTIALQNTPLLKGKLPALPTTQTLSLAPSQSNT